jgi:hypothetical protein
LAHDFPYSSINKTITRTIAWINQLKYVATNSPMDYHKNMIDVQITVVETREFRSQAKKLLGQEEILALINHLSQHPTDGDLIEGTGGMRKLRWRRPGTGKSGGYRVIHFFHDTNIPLFLFTVYAKSNKDNLSNSDVKILKKATSQIVSFYKAGVKNYVRNH